MLQGFAFRTGQHLKKSVVGPEKPLFADQRNPYGGCGQRRFQGFFALFQGRVGFFGSQGIVSGQVRQDDEIDKDVEQVRAADHPCRETRDRRRGPEIKIQPDVGPHQQDEQKKGDPSLPRGEKDKNHQAEQIVVKPGVPSKSQRTYDCVQDHQGDPEGEGFGIAPPVVEIEAPTVDGHRDDVDDQRNKHAQLAVNRDKCTVSRQGEDKHQVAGDYIAMVAGRGVFRDAEQQLRAPVSKSVDPGLHEGHSCFYTPVMIFKRGCYRLFSAFVNPGQAGAASDDP